MKAFSGRLYRPDVAPAEAPAEAVGDGEVDGTPGAGRAPGADGHAAGGPSNGGPPARQERPAGDGTGPRLVISNPLFEATPSKRK